MIGSLPVRALRIVRCPNSNTSTCRRLLCGQSTTHPSKKVPSKKISTKPPCKNWQFHLSTSCPQSSFAAFCTGEQPQDIATRLEMLVNQTARRSAIQNNGAEVSPFFIFCKVGNLRPDLSPLHANLKNRESSIFHLLPKAFLGVFRVMRRISIRKHA